MKRIYVSVSGDDALGTGSRRRPFRTPEKAIGVSRSYADAKRAVVFLEGNYPLSRPLTLTPADSGLTLIGENAVLSGALCIPADWEKDGETYRAYIGKDLPVDRVFTNGEERTCARFPNERKGVLPLGGSASKSEIKQRAARYADPAGAHLLGMHALGWGGSDYVVTGKDPSDPTGLALQWIGDNNRGAEVSDELVIENVREELDAPNEWYYDKADGNLYFIPENEADLTDVSVCLTDELIRIDGADGVTIRSLGFFGTKRSMFTGKPYCPLLRGDWSVMRSGAIFGENTVGLCVTGCSFRSLGGNAVFLSGSNRDALIDGNEFTDIGASAIQLVGLPSAVRDPSYWPNGLMPELPVHRTSVEEPWAVGPCSDDYVRDVTVRCNHIFNVGVWEKQSAGINLSVCSRISVLHNTIHRSPRSGINVNDGTFGGHEIAYNDVFDCQRETSDHGQFNSWGRDRFWSVPRYNAMGENGELIRHYPCDGREYDVSAIDAYQTTRIHDNRFHHFSSAASFRASELGETADSDAYNEVCHRSTWGIDLDDGSSYYEIYNNLCLGMGIKLRDGFSRVVRNNILVGGQLQFHVTYAEARDVIENNVIINDIPYGLALVDEARFRAARYSIGGNVCFGGEAVFLPAWFDRDGCGIDPCFADPSVNDYTVTSAGVLERGFVNFSMKQFGAPGCPYTAPVSGYYGCAHAFIPENTVKIP